MNINQDGNSRRNERMKRSSDDTIIIQKDSGTEDTYKKPYLNRDSKVGDDTYQFSPTSNFS